MTQFTEETKRLLEKAGWHEGRQVDPTPYVEALQKRGYTVFPPVVEFLRQFGGLEFYSLEYDSFIQRFDPTNTYATSPAAVNHDAAAIGVPLCPIGEADDYTTTLMMDPAGKIYYRLEDGIYHIEGTAEAGLNALLGNIEANMIKIWPK